MGGRYYDQMFGEIWKAITKWWGFDDDVQKLREILLNWTEQQEDADTKRLESWVAATDGTGAYSGASVSHLVTGCLLKENFVNMYVGGAVCAAAPMLQAMITPCFGSEFAVREEDFDSKQYHELLQKTIEHYQNVDPALDAAVDQALDGIDLS